MEITVQPHWRTVDFISDLHLQVSAPATYQAWRYYLAHTPADALFILGDWFEVWIGDDVLQQPDHFESQCCQAVSEASKRMAIFVMHGNRDFLIGQDCMRVCNATLVSDPCILNTGLQRWLLSHGDALCIADTDYMEFRKQVRSLAWQAGFLAKPIEERQAIAQQLRQQSEQRKQKEGAFIDADNTLARTWLEHANATHLIHGHTHQPGMHQLDQQRQRWVLSDWDLSATPARAEIVRMRLCKTSSHPLPLERLSLQQATST